MGIAEILILRGSEGESDTVVRLRDSRNNREDVRELGAFFR
jgi:hypothetical protein